LGDDANAMLERRCAELEERAGALVKMTAVLERRCAMLEHRVPEINFWVGELQSRVLELEKRADGGGAPRPHY